MDYKKEILKLLEILKSEGIDRDKIEEGIGAAPNYLDQVLSRGGNKTAYNKIKIFTENILQKTTPVTITEPGVILEALIRIESMIGTNSSYIAEIYGKLVEQPATKILKDMEQMSEERSLKMLEALKKR